MMPHQSIEKKITIGSSLAIVLVFGFVLIANYWIASSQSQKSYNLILDQKLAELSKTLEAPLWAFDDKTLAIICDAYLSDTDVVSLEVFSSNTGNKLYSKTDNTTGSILYKQGDILRGDQLIGNVKIGLSDSRHIDNLYGLLLYSAIAIVFIVITLVAVVRALLKKHLVIPLGSLCQWAIKVASGDYTEEPKAIIEKELQPLVREFRTMSEKVKTRETSLRDSERKFRELADLLPGIVYEASLDRRITYMNQTGLEKLGYSREEILADIFMDDLIIKEQRNVVKDNVRRIIDEGHFGPNEYRAVRKDGKIFPILAFSSPILKGEQVLGIRGVILDVSDQKALENQLAQSQKMEAIGVLAGGIAHDFNNILSAVLGYSELILMRNKLDLEDKKSLEEVLTAAERAKELVKQILMFSRKSEEARHPLEIHSIVEEALKLVIQTMPATIKIDTSIDPETGCVIADATQIHQIVMNLCTNAFHAMKDSGGELTVALAPVEVSRVAAQKVPNLNEGSYALLKVEDNGKGISPEDLPSIFDPFFTTKAVGEGTGMGLSVVHGIIQNYGGVIGVESNLESGTTFKVFLPLVQAEDTEATAAVETPQTGSGHILLVDDEPSVVNMMKKTLESLGYRVTSATYPQEALDVFKADLEGFDLLLTDQTMPEMTGVMLAKEAMRLRPGFPVIICTGYSEVLDEPKAQAMGIRALLMKPVDRTNLAKKLRRVLDDSAKCH